MSAEATYLEAPRTIDQEMSDLTSLTHETTMLSNSHRNALTPVFKLSDDITLDIFLFVRDSSDRRLKNWHQIAQICGYWRRVAVAAPSLWTSLYDPPHAITPLMLERSQTAPLDVFFSTLRPKHSTATLMSILHEIERIRTLTLGIMPPDFLDTAHDVLAKLDWNWKASLLESLNVGIAPSPGPRAAPVKLVMDVFRPTRLLRKVYLIGGHYDWGMLPLPSLTHLGLYGESLGKVSGVQLIETLRGMPNLEVLGIEWEGMNLYQYPPTPCPQPINLPCLQKLEVLCGNQVQFESFLSLVKHPRLHQLSIGSSCPENNIVPFTKSVLSSIRDGHFSPLEFLKIEFEDVTISARPWSDYYDGSFIRMVIPINEVEFDISDNGRGLEFIVDIMSCMAPFNCPDKIPLRHIYLDKWDASIDSFSRLFASFPHLESIEVHHNLALVLFKVLNIASSTDGANTPIPFPNLRKIIWNGEHRHTSLVPLLPAAVFSDIYSALLSRHIHNTAIIRLELVGCPRLDGIRADQLREIGVEVVVRKNR